MGKGNNHQDGFWQCKKGTNSIKIHKMQVLFRSSLTLFVKSKHLFYFLPRCKIETCLLPNNIK